MRKLLQAALITGAVASLGGCVPAASFAVASPGCTSYTPWTHHSRTSLYTAKQRLQTVQARYQAGYQFEQRNPNRWRGAATGECR